MHSFNFRSSLRTVVAGLLLAGTAAGAACGRTATEQAAPEGAGVTVFEGARVIVGDGTPAIENATFTVRDGRFVQVGREGDVQVPEGATRVSLAGKTVMPAIIDTHVHLRSQMRETLVEDLERRAYYGVSAAMSLGQDVGDVPYQVRDQPIPNAALFRTAGRGITMPEPGRTEVPYWVTTEAEARKAVQENAARKVDIIKIWVDDRMGMYKKLTPELYGAIIDEAHKNGLRVTAHIYNLEDAKGLLRANLDAFAHGIRDRDADEEVMALFKEHPQVVVVPNLPNTGQPVDLSWVDTLPAGELQKLQAAASKPDPEAQKMFGIQARNLAKLSSAGVKIALGTDGNTPHGPHLEMADMVASGMTPAQVLVAATSSGAEFMRLPDLGSVAAGKRADFLVLDANPLDDITNTRRINAFYMNGTALDRAAMRSRWTSAGTQ
jgi:imidazolonepropionase-like amidohydrolase